MARTVQEIKAEIGNAYCQDPTIVDKYQLPAAAVFDEHFSKVSVESILFYIVAFAIHVVERLFDTHKHEVDIALLDRTPHTVRWYANKAMQFQYGYNLQADTDTYDNTGISNDMIEASKVVKYAAVVEREKDLVVKVAKIQGDDLTKLSAAELGAFGSYMQRVKDAGVRIVAVSEDAERLRLELTVYYNPLVLRSDGSRIDNASSSPVRDAVRSYLKNIQFNGTVVLSRLIDDLQQLEGVVIPHLQSAKYAYGALDWVDFDVYYRPFSGYIRIADADLIVNYIPTDL
jgi:hypothetical protein